MIGLRIHLFVSSPNESANITVAHVSREQLNNSHLKPRSHSAFLIQSRDKKQKIKIINLLSLFDLFNFVCFTGDYILTGFGRDQAIKRCVTGSKAPSTISNFYCRYLYIISPVLYTGNGVAGAG
jgi:hypothetical protein